MTSGDPLPEPVRRYLTHAVRSGEAGAPGVRLTMSGRIKVGFWLPFSATQWCDGKSFLWRASVGLGPLHPLVVTDRYEDGKGSMSGKLAGRWTLFAQADSNVVRSAAGRTALEAIFAPRGLVPERGYAWRAEGDDHIVASNEIPPERVEIHLHIAPGGRLLNVVAQRWGKLANGTFGYLPFGADIHAEQRFGDLVIPSRVTAGWNYGTDTYRPFFKATITTASPA